jgi:hypothetical protein
VLNEPLEVTFKVTNVFDHLAVPYLIGGSLASTLYGLVRTTQDSDLIAQMRAEHIQPFVDALEAEFYIDPQMVSTAVQQHGSFNLIHRETFFKVDVFVPPMRPFLQSQLRRAREQVFTLDTEVRAKFASPEDTILAKLEWYRLGGEVSERQWRDVLGILMIQGDNLDLDYLHHWAAELDLAGLLLRALQETA